MITRFFKNSTGLRMIIIGILTLIMLIPVEFVERLIDERQARRDEATKEVSEKWGGSQMITGPIISIPYKSFVRQQSVDDKGVTKTEVNEVTEYLHILPETLAIATTMQPEVRYRGIYEVILYRSSITLKGAFLLNAVRESGIDADKILWQEANVSLGITDLKGIKQVVNIRFNDADYLADPGLNNNLVLEQGISIKPPLNGLDRAAFSLTLDLNGSSELMFVPVGRETSVSVTSNWGNPSFAGAYLPESREVSAQKFTASWKILHLNRNYPQSWSNNAYTVKESAFGVKLKLAIDEYQRTMRTAKYALMFLALTFLSFFMAEILTKRVIHPIQYVLIGLGLVIFYTLLLSISEQLNFNRAYLLSSAAIIILITGYTRSVLKNWRATGIIFGILVILYGFLFVVLQQQDYALLFGSIGLFVILGVVMYITRNIDWFSIGGQEEEKEEKIQKNDETKPPLTT